MPSYKLIYFDARGVGEASRMLFAAAGVEYEDCRVSPPQWPALKPTMPFGQIPVLEVDGEQIPQSRAIENYLARELGLYGSDSREMATIDVVCETAREFRELFTRMFHAREDPKEKQKLVTELSDTLAPKLMANLEKYLKKNTGGAGWFVGNSITYADVIVFQFMETVVRMISEDLFKNFPILKANFKRVSSHKGIAAWLEKRPDTPF